MRKIVYDFAMTLDGFICHPDGSADGFLADGEHATEYLNRLKSYDTVIMGRKTYEFGYEFGLQPGARAYPHMEHFIFSKTLQLESDEVNVVDADPIEVVQSIKESEGSDIYLCGGGIFAGTLLDHELIDQVVIKLNPVFFGCGIRAFGESSKQINLDLLECRTYDNGVNLLRYNILYGE